MFCSYGQKLLHVKRLEEYETNTDQLTNLGLYPSHTALRERRDASVTAPLPVAEASRRSRSAL